MTEGDQRGEQEVGVMRLARAQHVGLQDTGRLRLLP